jgi:hypothetical protein
MELKKISITHFIVEVFSVVFAVLLALGVNEWRESNNNEDLATEALSKVIQEIESNQNRLSKVLLNHKNIITEIDTVISKLKRKDDIVGFGDIIFEAPSRTAWDAAVLTAAVNYLDYDMVEKITSVYSTQKVYTDVSDRVFQELVFFVPDKGREEMVKQFTKQKIYVMNLISIEEQLSEEYSKFLDENKR